MHAQDTLQTGNSPLSGWFSGSGYADVTFGLGGEYQFGASPWSVRARYDFMDRSSGSHINEFLLGVRYTVGAGTIKARDENVPTFNNFSEILGIQGRF